MLHGGKKIAYEGESVNAHEVSIIPLLKKGERISITNNNKRIEAQEKLVSPCCGCSGPQPYLDLSFFSQGIDPIR